MFRTRPPGWLALAAAAAALIALPAESIAQRGSPSSTGGGGGGRSGDSSGSKGGDSSGSRGGGSGGSSSTPQRDSSPPPRSESSPRRDYTPPPKQESSSPRRDYSPPPKQESSAPRRDYSPPSKSEDSTPRRDYSPPKRDDSTPRRDYSPPKGEDSAPRRDYRPPSGRDDAAPRRDDSGPRSERATDRAPRTIDRGSRPDRHDPDDIFNRSRPRQDPGGSSDTNVQRHPIGTGQRIERTRTEDPTPQRNRAQDIFSKSSEGRHYNNGAVLRAGGYISHDRIRYYFPWGYSYYPFYCPTYDYGSVFYSPYSYYYGCAPSYVYQKRCFYTSPSLIYIEAPTYVGSDCRGYDSDLDDYYLSRNDYRFEADRDRDLDRAIDDIRDAFRLGSVEPLVNLTEPDVRIAIFRRGKYEYSLSPNDYLDMTRDALRATETIQFDLYRVRRRATGVYVVSGKHVYLSRESQRRTVYVSFVLERLHGRWILTQVGTAPDRIQEF